MSRGLVMTREQATAHQAHHGFTFKPEIVPPKEVAKVDKLRKGRQMTKTEEEFGRILEARKTRGEIISYDFEAVTLRWGGLRYTPDYLVIEPIDDGRHHRICFFEVKGGFIWDDSRVKFLAARDHFKWAHFELHQKKSGQWQRLF